MLAEQHTLAVSLYKDPQLPLWYGGWICGTGSGRRGIVASGNACPCICAPGYYCVVCDPSNSGVILLDGILGLVQTHYNEGFWYWNHFLVYDKECS